MNDLSQYLALGLADLIGSLLVPLLIIGFCVAVVLKICIYYQARRQLAFMSGLETHVHWQIDGGMGSNGNDFHDVVRNILQRTYTDAGIWRPRLIYSRKEDAELKFMSSVFMVDRAVKVLMADTLKHVRHFASAGRSNDWDLTANYIMSANPYFTKLFGFLSVASTNRVLMTLPSVFIVVGILGTFLGIVQGLPALAALDPKDVAGAQETLGTFLNSMAAAMTSSVFGIFLSVIFNMLNSVLSITATLTKCRDKLSQSLALLWQDANIENTSQVERKAKADLDREMIASVGPAE